MIFRLLQTKVRRVGFLCALLSCLLPISSISADCPDYSWLVELHSRERASNCASAQQEIQKVVNSISLALKSGRNVELENFGEFYLKPVKRSNKLPLQTRKVIFKPARQFMSELNESKKYLSHKKAAKVREH